MIKILLTISTGLAILACLGAIWCAGAKLTGQFLCTTGLFGFIAVVLNVLTIKQG